MKNLKEEIQNMELELLQKKKQLTIMEGSGENQDGNHGIADAVTGETDYSKQEFASKKKMLVSKMKMRE